MKQFVIILLAVLSSVWTNGRAREVSQEQARQKALSFLQANKAARGARFVGKSVEDVRLCYTSSDEGTPAFYVFNADDKGFVIVSAEDRTEEILGYSANGQFDEEHIPDALRELLQDYARQIAALGEDSSLSGRPDAAAAFVGAKQIETAQWNQRAPYNYYCPENCLAGCVATATAIIMRHYGHPDRGSGTHSYQVPYTGETLSADFSEHTYAWDAMPMANAQSGTDANYRGVARLIADIGIAVEMQYTPDFSSASIWDARQALVEYFSYSPKARFLSADDFSGAEWSARLREEVNNDRLVLYCGQSSSDGGHAFVVDGYSDDLFSINWGWGGYCNGYFSLGRLQPNEINPNYSTDQCAVLSIMPSDGTEGLLSPLVFYADEAGYSGFVSNGTDVKAGEPYTIKTGNVLNNGEETFNGQLFAALFDKNDVLKEVISGGINMSLGSGWYYSELNIQCNATVDAVDEDYIALVTKADGSDDYLFVADEDLNVCKLPATRYTPPTAIVTFEHKEGVSVSPLDYANFYYQSQPLTGAPYYFRLEVPGDVVKIVVRCGDKRLQSTSTDGRLYCIDRLMGDETITIKTYTESELIPLLKVHVNTAGTLGKELKGYDFDAIQAIEVSGNVDQRDFVVLNRYFSDIDMRAATVKAYAGYPANSIPAEAFARNERLTRFIMPANITSISSNAFMWTSLTEVVIPAGVKSFGVNVFNYCRQLKEVTVLNPKPAFINWCVLIGTLRDQGGTLHVPAGAKAAYEAASEWNQFTYIVEDAVDIYTGIGAVNATKDPKASFSLNGNTVSSATGKPLSVYDMAGRRVARGTTVTLKSGTYVIVSGETRTKVMVR